MAWNNQVVWKSNENTTYLTILRGPQKCENKLWCNNNNNDDDDDDDDNDNDNNNNNDNDNDNDDDDNDHDHNYNHSHNHNNHKHNHSSNSSSNNSKKKKKTKNKHKNATKKCVVRWSHAAVWQEHHTVLCTCEHAQSTGTTPTPTLLYIALLAPPVCEALQ